MALGAPGAPGAPEGEIRCPVGTRVYVPSPHSVWATAAVVSVDSSSGVVVAKLDAEDRVITLKKGEPFYLCNTDEWNSRGLCAPDDLTCLTHLHEAAVLDSLDIRFELDAIYTFTGPILIAVNPFKTLKGLYDYSMLKRYILAQSADGVDPPNASSGSPRDILKEPHVFATSSAAYEGMCVKRVSQTILISGESGAGKTESTKFVMKFLACAGSESLEKRSTVEAQVLDSNPLLEAFGNARTLRNDNSSRFGKFIELQFFVDKDVKGLQNGKLCGARIQTYLLEKVRVCQQQEGERNFHIFYQLCAAAARAQQTGGIYTPRLQAEAGSQENATNGTGGAPIELDMSLYAPREHFKFLTCSSCYQLQGIDDADAFDTTVKAMQTLGMKKETISSIFEVVAAILCLGNTTFEVDSQDSEAADIADSSLVDMRKAAQMLGVSPEALKEAMCFRTIKTTRESLRKPLRKEEATEMRSALCRALYGCLFLRVVEITNSSIGFVSLDAAPPLAPNAINNNKNSRDLLFCGVLDIFGFECFDRNSFEQLCINYTNERLQQFFNSFVFLCEEQLYKEEGIAWSPLDFPDNADCVALLQDKQNGVFAMLDEECVVPGGSNRGYALKLVKKHSPAPASSGSSSNSNSNSGGSSRFRVNKTRQNTFIIKHFAGEVEYCTDGFLEKNKDVLSLDLQNCISAAHNTFVSELFLSFLNRGGGGEADGDKQPSPQHQRKRKAVTVSGEFREQLQALMETIGGTNPHFIRCIKPNPQNLPDIFNRASVNEQLRYGGVLQAVQVSRAGYPVRLLHIEAVKDYKPLADKALQQQLQEMQRQLQKEHQAQQQQSWREMAQLLFKQLDVSLNLGAARPAAASEGVTTWAVGRTLCFFKRESYEVLAAALVASRTAAATKIQARFKGYERRRAFLELKRDATIIQRAVRVWLKRRAEERKRQHEMAIKIQSFLRMAVQRNKYLRLLRAFTRVQALWRGRRGRELSRNLKADRAAARIQATWRMKKQKEAYKTLKYATIKTQLRWRRMLAIRQLRRLKAEARDVAGLVKLVQGLKQELSDARQQIQEAANRDLQQQARIDELQKQLQQAKKEATELRAELKGSSETFSAQQKQLEELRSLLKREEPTAVADEAAATSAGSTSRRSIGTAPEIEDLKALVTKREEDSRAKQQEHAALVQQLQQLQQKLKEEQQRRQQAEAKYKLVLEDSIVRQSGDGGVALQQDHSTHIVKKHQPSVATAATGGVSSTSEPTAGPTIWDRRFIDLMLLGPPKVGKRELLKALADQLGDPKALMQLKDPADDDSNFEQLVKIKLPEGTQLLCLCFTYDKARLSIDLVKQRVGQAFVVAAIFDPTRHSTCETCFYLLQEAVIPAIKEAESPELLPTRVFLVENNWGAASRRRPVEVDVKAARDAALMHLSSLYDDLKPWLTALAEYRRTKPDSTKHRKSTKSHHSFSSLQQHPQQQSSGSGLLRSPGSLSATLIDSIRNFVSSGRGSNDASKKSMRINQELQFLLPSVPVKNIQLPERQKPCDSVVPVVEIPNGKEDAVTCLAFGAERKFRDFILLAAASKGGRVNVYRCYRTSMEKESLDAAIVPYSANPAYESKTGEQPQVAVREASSLLETTDNITLHSQMVGHSKAVTCMLFSLLEDYLITTSIDLTIRFWAVDTGANVKVFQDSAIPLSVAFLPFNPSMFITSNSNSMLRLVCSIEGKVLQKMKLDSEVRTLRFDDTGLFCFAGNKAGQVCLLEASDTTSLVFRYRLDLSKGSITCISFVPSRSPTDRPLLLVNCSDSNVALVECVYGTKDGSLTNLQVIKRLKIKHEILPLKNCFLNTGSGWLISGCEDSSVFCYPLRENASTKSGFHLPGHSKPVLTVAVNAQGTLLASGDSYGSIILWRRLAPAAAS